MLVIKANAIMSQAKLTKLTNTLTEQAKNGVVVLPDFCDLLTEVEASEGIRVERAASDPSTVLIPADEWMAAMDYIRALHDCATCKHETDGTACLASDVDCTVCADRTSCACANCHNGSRWEWRHGHGKD